MRNGTAKRTRGRIYSEHRDKAKAMAMAMAIAMAMGGRQATKSRQHMATVEEIDVEQFTVRLVV